MPRSLRTFERALVTGASSGIGRHMADQLAAARTHLIVVARREHLLEELADELRARRGVEVEVLAADLADPDDRARVEQRLERTDDPVDLLINNAGLSQMGRFSKLGRSRASAQIDVNMIAPVRLTHAALRTMVPRQRGAVLMTASTAAFQPLPSLAVYAATKAFLLNFGQALHEELRGTGVTTTVLCPGFTDTAFVGEGSPVPKQVLMDPADVARIGLAAARHGRSVVTAGVGNKAHRALATLVPGSLLRRAAGKAL